MTRDERSEALCRTQEAVNRLMRIAEEIIKNALTTEKLNNPHIEDDRMLSNLP